MAPRGGLGGVGNLERSNPFSKCDFCRGHLRWRVGGLRATKESARRAASFGRRRNRGNFIAADGAYQTGPISQTVNGLTTGKSYTVSFYFAGAQQYGFTGATTEQWLVSLGSQQLATAVLSDTSHGFTGWQYTSLTFTATATSEVLSFLAVGTPSGVPPFTLLDGVSMVAAPEPGSAAMLVTGVLAIAFFARRRHLGRAIA